MVKDHCLLRPTGSGWIFSGVFFWRLFWDGTAVYLLGWLVVLINLFFFKLQSSRRLSIKLGT